MTLPFDAEEFLAAVNLPGVAELATWAERPLRAVTVVWREDGPSLRAVAPEAGSRERYPTYRNALEQFLKLSREGVRAETFGRFAMAHGLLGVDDDGSLLGAYRDEREYMSEELVWWHRYYARLALAITRLATSCHGHHLVYVEDLWTIREHARRLLAEYWEASGFVGDVLEGRYPLGADEGDNEAFKTAVWATRPPEGFDRAYLAGGFGLLQAVQPFGDVIDVSIWPPAAEHGNKFEIAPPRTDHGAARPRDSKGAATILFREAVRALTSEGMDQWNACRDVQPRVEWDTEGPRIVWTGGLWGALGTQMITAARFGAGVAACYHCGRELKRQRRAKEGQRAWCDRKACQRASARERMKRKRTKEKRNAKA